MSIALEDETLVNLHTIRDVVGAVCIGAELTVAGKKGDFAKKVTLAQLRDSLRKGFTKWQTMPEEIQTDNETLFVGSNGSAKDAFPAKFTLWLIGLGIEHRAIRAGVCTDNAEVERCHRTLDDYVFSGNKHLPMPKLQEKLDYAQRELAFELPSFAHGCQGQPPVQAHPQLLSLIHI